MTNKQFVNNIRILSVMLVFLLFGNRAYADACWKTGGCENNIVYVYVPPMQYNKENYKDFKCANWRVFDGNFGLPKVGSVVKVVQEKEGIKSYENLNLIEEKHKGFSDYVKSYKHKDNYKKFRELETCLEYEYMTKDEPDYYRKINGDIGCDMKLEVISYVKLKEGLFALLKILTSDYSSKCD